MGKNDKEKKHFVQCSFKGNVWRLEGRIWIYFREVTWKGLSLNQLWVFSEYFFYVRDFWLCIDQFEASRTCSLAGESELLPLNTSMSEDETLVLLWKDLILLGRISYLTQARFKFPTHSPTSLNKCNLFFFLLGGSPTFTLSLLTGWFCATFHIQRMCCLSFSYKKIIHFPLSISITVCIVI